MKVRSGELDIAKAGGFMSAISQQQVGWQYVGIALSRRVVVGIAIADQTGTAGQLERPLGRRQVGCREWNSEDPCSWNSGVAQFNADFLDFGEIISATDIGRIPCIIRNPITKHLSQFREGQGHAADLIANRYVFRSRPYS